MNHRICVATPLYGRPDAATVSWGYHQALSNLAKSPEVSVLDSRMFINVDLVRARSSAVRMFLESNCTHLLFWDEDVYPRDIRALGHMLSLDLDVIALPYPKKQIHWDRVEVAIRDEEEQARQGRQEASELEGAGLDWAVRSMQLKPDERGIVKTQEVGLGFTLMRRSMLERMCARYADELTFIDDRDSVPRPTVALFQLIIRNKALYSEDYSFFLRWADMGGEAHILVDPARHVGSYVFGQTLQP